MEFVKKLLVWMLLSEVALCEYVPGEVLVKFKEEECTLSTDCRILSAKRVFGGEDPELSRVYKLKVKGDIFDVISKLERDPNIEYAEPNYIRRICVKPNDEHFDKQWGLSVIDAKGGWDIETGTASVIIAVVDTGVDYNHKDLECKVVRGWDFANNDNDPADDHGHGTHVAGIAAAKGYNGIGIAGVAWGCGILAVKCLDSAGYGDDADCAEAVRYSAGSASVINMSWGAPEESKTLREACDYAVREGCILVGAAGNSNTDYQFYPAGYSNVLAVAATDREDKKAWFSNHGDWVDVSAPGVGILSTVLNGSYESWSGTSMAAPFVSGLFGLLFSRYGTANFSSVTGFCDDIGRSDFGRMNLYYALSRENRPPAEFSLIQPQNLGFTVSIYPTFRWRRAEDPDWNDKVIYRIYLNEEEMTITENLFWIPRMDQSLRLETEYTWYVIAEDSRGSVTFSNTATFTTSEISVFPNPASEYVIFRGVPLEKEETRIRIYNIAGELIRDIPYKKGKDVVWDTSVVASGVYIYVIEEEGRVWKRGKIGIIR
jgi:thermitase